MATEAVALTLVLWGVFLLGRCTLLFKIARLKKENRLLRDLLHKALRLEELNLQTYTKAVRTCAEDENQAQHSPGRVIRPPCRSQKGR